VSTAFGSPFGDEILPQNVADICAKLVDMGCDEISVGDTIGVGVPSQVDELLPLLAKRIDMNQIAFHFHDTRGTALANVYAALQGGVHIFDSSAGGLGGCPYAPGATGNVGTEDVLYLLHSMGIETGIDLAKIRAASRFISGILGHSLTSKAFQAMEASEARAAAKGS
jgi:hydroxymethylglutaryl-CoA lyase